MSSTEYALLIAPSSNRVYQAAAAELAISELQVLDRACLGGLVGEVRVERLGGVDYVRFQSRELGQRELALLSNLSALFALFALEAGKLTPIELERADVFDSDLMTIQKYSGKTNESFTKLLLNVTLSASAFAREFPGRKFGVLDPMCGRGTSLNQALTYGFDASGIEIDRKDFDAYSTFIQRWVKDKRLKHSFKNASVKGQRVFTLEFAAEKAAYRAGDTLRLCCANADTELAAELFPRASFDLIVTDAPYGVQHGSHRGQGSLSRGPLELLSDALPKWREALRPGGAVGISWNTLSARRDALAAALARAGFELPREPAYEGFKHRVDQAIVRDLVVARKD